MRIYQTPVHRKTIVPWYDSEPVCAAALLMFLAVFLFSLVGIRVAGEVPLYRDFIWVPGLVTALSGTGFVSVTVRLIRRHAHRFARSPEA